LVHSRGTAKAILPGDGFELAQTVPAIGNRQDLPVTDSPANAPFFTVPFMAVMDVIKIEFHKPL
jgi:hypothetical protein